MIWFFIADEGLHQWERFCKHEIMNLLKNLDRLRVAHTQLSRAGWLCAAGVAESTWYRWQSGENSPTVANLERLAAQIDCEIVPKWNPPNVYKRAKTEALRAAQAKSQKKVSKKRDEGLQTRER